MTPIFIRQVSVSDAELIANLSRKTFYDTFAAANTKEDMDLFMEKQFSKEMLIKEMGADGNIFFLAYYENEVAGYVLMREGEHYPEFGNCSSIEIVRIYALQTFIGKGIGSALVKKCIEHASEQKKEIIWLGVWEHNKRAIDFYSRWGFEKFGEHEFILGKDVQTDWLMKKML